MEQYCGDLHTALACVLSTFSVEFGASKILESSITSIDSTDETVFFDLLQENRAKYGIATMIIANKNFFIDYVCKYTD